MATAKVREIIEEDKISGKIYDGRLFTRLLKYGKPYWYFIALAVLMIIVAAVLETVGPYLTQIAVDKYIIPGDYEGLVTIITIYISVLAGNFLIRYLQILLTQ
jgi:ATP-binding cassette subfamily B protein